MATDGNILDAVQRRIVSARRAGNLDVARFWISVLRHVIASSSVARPAWLDEQIVEATTAGCTTLGSLLGIERVAHTAVEKDWVVLVEAIAAGDARALDEVYQRTAPLVFALITGIGAGHPESAEDLTVAAFHDVWRRASTYEPEAGTVVGWVMNQARARAIDAHDGLAVGEGRSLVQFVPRPVDFRTEPAWVEVAPGISYELLSVDTERDRISMLVKLAAGAVYPPHQHAGVEELHLLHGEVVIDEKTLRAGAYLRSETGSVDERVWSAGGCTCVLTTSTRDVLR